jgi:D-alanyl-lipoteichoic acid acyltransferase DltB (MBOAT superfamily)
MKWGKWASIYGVFITFLIIGIWHGASWNFVILGLLQGIAINYEYFTKKKRLEIGRKMPIWLNLTLSRFFTLVFICFSHVFFYTNNLKDAILYFSGMFKETGSDQMTSNISLHFKDLIILCIGFLIILISEYRDETGRKSIKSALLDNKSLYWIVMAIAVVILLITGITKSTGFIYEQF